MSIKNKVFNSYSYSNVKNTATDENGNIFFEGDTISNHDAITK
jgi:hypothetical protein